MGIWGAFSKETGYGVARISKNSQITEVLNTEYESDVDAALAAHLLNEQEGLFDRADQTD